MTDLAGPGCTETFSQKPRCVGDPAQNRLRLWLHADDIQDDSDATNDVTDAYTDPVRAASAFPTANTRPVVRWVDRSGFGNDAVPVGDSASRVVTSATKTAMGSVMVPRVQRYFPGGIDCGDPSGIMVPFGRPGHGCTLLPADSIDRASASAPALNPAAWTANPDSFLLRYPFSGVVFASVPPLTALQPTEQEDATIIPVDYEHRCTIESGIGHACDVMVTEQPLSAAGSSVPDVEVFMVARMFGPNARQTLFNLAMPADGGFTNAGDFRARLSNDYEHETEHRPSPGRVFSRNFDLPLHADVTQQRATKLWFIAAPGTRVEGDTSSSNCSGTPDGVTECVVSDQLSPSNEAALAVELGVDARPFNRRSIYPGRQGGNPSSVLFYEWVDTVSANDVSMTERRFLVRYPQIWNFSSSVSQRKQFVALNGVELGSDNSGHALYIPENHVASWGWGFSPDGNSPSVQMNLHEFMVFFSPLNDAERAMVNASLALEWGLILPPDSLQFFYRQPRNIGFSNNSSDVCGGSIGVRDLRGNGWYDTLFCASSQAFRWVAYRQLLSQRLGGIGALANDGERIETGSSGPLTLSSPLNNGFLSRPGQDPNQFKFILILHGNLNTTNVPVRYYNHYTSRDTNADGSSFNMRREHLPGPDRDNGSDRRYSMDGSQACALDADGRPTEETPLPGSSFSRAWTCWDASPSLVDEGVYPEILWLVSTVNVDQTVSMGATRTAPDNDLVTFTFRLADMGYNRAVRQRGALPGRKDGADFTPAEGEAWDPWPTYGFIYRLTFAKHFNEKYRDFYTSTNWYDFRHAANICRLGISTSVNSDKAKCKPTGQCADVGGLNRPAADYNIPYPQTLTDTFIGMPVQHGVYQPGEPTIGPTSANDRNQNGIHDGAEDDTVSFTLDAGHFATRSSDGANLGCDSMNKFTLRIHDLVDPIQDLDRTNTHSSIVNRNEGTEGLWLGPTLRCCPKEGLGSCLTEAGFAKERARNFGW